MEIWKDIKGYENIYQVSNFGNVKNTRTNRIIKSKKNSKGYMLVGLYKDGERKNFYVHRLVAIAFLQNPLKLQYINHKDENKENNNVDNLEWCSCSYNNNYGTRNNKVSNANGKLVYQYTTNGFYLRTWTTITAAEKYYNISHGKISMCCNGKRKMAGGYVWKYKKEAE